MLDFLALRSVTFAVAATLVMMPATVVGEPTDLDPSFGVEGIVRLQSYTFLREAAAFPDGGIALLIADGAAPYAQSVVRLDAFGGLDATFTPVTALPDLSIGAIAVTPAGRLVTLQGIALTPQGELWLTRHLGDGSLDPAFGQSGRALVSRFPFSQTAHLAPSGEFSSGLAVDPSGRLYISTALSRVGTVTATWITRVGATGSPVEQLNRTDPALSGFIYGQLRADTDGTIVAALPVYQQVLFGGPKVGGPALVRLVGGVPDPTFGSGGIAFHPMANWITYSDRGTYDFASTPDGGYVVVGVAQDREGQDQIVAVKFTATGAVDAAFGESGVVFLKLARPRDFVNNVKLAVQPDGRLVVASTIQDVNDGLFFLIRLGRLTVTGQPDPRFAAGGVASFWVGGGALAKFLSVRPDGRIVVAGDIVTENGFSNQPAVLQFLGGDSTRTRPLSERVAIEYFHAGYGHYFLTADAHEIADLDVPNPSGWARTGHSFRVWDDDDPSLRPACRFWSDQSFAPKSSHFYTPYEAECSALKAGSTWRFERDAFSVRMPAGPAGSGACPVDSRPLYRAYNNGRTGAPNHRYITDPALLDEMIAQGWTMEGEATTRVFACVPIQ